MSTIPKKFIESIVTISVITTNNQKNCIGTGFLIGYLVGNINNTKKYGLFLITNKHVLQNQKKVFIGFNQINAPSSFEAQIDLEQNGQLSYSMHMNPAVDIVAMNINVLFLQQMNAQYQYFRFDDDALKIQDMQSKNIFEGDIIYSLGYPLNLVNTSSKNPICRLGCVSRIADLYIPSNPEVNFLVDAQSFPGNSGGPIILIKDEIASNNENRTNSYLIGILHKNILYQDQLISARMGNAQSILSENSGLTMVHPVDFIEEVIKLEILKIGINNITSC